MAQTHEVIDFILKLVTLSENKTTAATQLWLQQWLFASNEGLKSKLLEPTRSKSNKEGLLEDIVENLLSNPSFSASYNNIVAQFGLQNGVENAIISSTIHAGGNVHVGNIIQTITEIKGDSIKSDSINYQINQGANSNYIGSMVGNGNIVGNNNEITYQDFVEKISRTKKIETPSEKELEKLLGTSSNIVKINWLEKGLKAAKSVCRVVLADGTKGTGFVLKGGYLLTNFHVIPKAEKAMKAKIEFNFEEEINGVIKQTIDYQLDISDFKKSSIFEYDFFYIKIIDRQDFPLAHWGFLELNTFSEPQIGDAAHIIQHPKGETKQICLRNNTIIGRNQHRLLYTTDTEKGSSGSPVFDNEWKVIALHHAGKTMEEGGLAIDEKGNRAAANEGILIKHIIKNIQ